MLLTSWRLIYQLTFETCICQQHHRKMNTYTFPFTDRHTHSSYYYIDERHDNNQTKNEVNKPKSQSFNNPVLLIKRFSGLMSKKNKNNKWSMIFFYDNIQNKWKKGLITLQTSMYNIILMTPLDGFIQLVYVISK